MPTLNIKDPEVYRLAAALADQRGTSMTAAVRGALVEALARRTTDGQARIARIEAAAQVASAVDAPWLTEDDLYDDHGLPR
ncbi:type II toxin-antitoxin system VapB family antitoxin [Nocardioides plantarum]|uniref:Type II toxin-antitoxin system VapB family antitoxin n=1 Tax=Nocardioides plantarum TaxID=29299 RepID=A0ABV5KGA0_9ACTN|nr:type II toxin-antitoxin system VapB family antitoxin [Nocardioides plantarum]